MNEQVTQTGHPKGLYLLFATEMWERFSYYGMRAIFILFLGKALLFDKSLSTQIYGSYTGLVYLTPLIGGYVADKYWGNRKSIIVGGILMACGQFMMFLSGSFFQTPTFASILMFVGLFLLIFGNGFFKPNISTMVGQLYPKGDKRIDSAFTIFYMGINLGAFIAPLVCGFLGERNEDPANFRWGFLAACVGMVISLITFILLKNKLLVTPEGVQIGDKPNQERENTTVSDTPKASIPASSFVLWGVVAFVLFWIFLIGKDFDLLGAFLKNPLTFEHHTLGMDFDLIGGIIFSFAIAIPGLIISDPSLTKIEKERIWVIYIACFFVIFFWSAFEQAGASLTYFADLQTNRNLLGTKVPASYFQSINAVAIVIFAPVFVFIWSKLAKKNMEPVSPYKQAIGLFLLAIGYLIIAFGVKGLGPGVKVSMMWLVSLYTIHTFGELCLSPIGLSMVNKLAPVRLASLLMGVYFLANATANKLAGTLSSLYPETLVPTEIVTSANSSANVNILKSNAKASDYNGKQVYTMEMLNFSAIKDEKLRDQINIDVQKGSVVKEKEFVGVKVNDLYTFFMIFVVMAGVASIILFVIAGYMVKMMHGIR